MSNRILNIDCIDGIKQVKDKSVQLIVADPPYFLGLTSNGKKGNKFLGSDCFLLERA